MFSHVNCGFLLYDSLNGIPSWYLGSDEKVCLLCWMIVSWIAWNVFVLVMMSVCMCMWPATKLIWVWICVDFYLLLKASVTLGNNFEFSYCSVLSWGTGAEKIQRFGVWDFFELTLRNLNVPLLWPTAIIQESARLILKKIHTKVNLMVFPCVRAIKEIWRIWKYAWRIIQFLSSL